MKNEISNIISRVKASKSLDGVDGVVRKVVRRVGGGELVPDKDSLAQLRHAISCQCSLVVHLGTNGNNPAVVRRQAGIIGQIDELAFDLNGSVGKQPTVPR